MTATDRAVAAGDDGYGVDPEPLPARGYRTYEVYQRERTGETTNLIRPRQLTSKAFVADPYPLLEILRENYPCYRDWPGNRFWITRYDDVTSVLADTANYEVRPTRFFYDRIDFGRDLGDELAVLTAEAGRIDAALPDVVGRVVGAIDTGLAAGDAVDLSRTFARRLPVLLWGAVLDLEPADLPGFAARWWRMQRGWSWHAPSTLDGAAAMDELVTFFEPMLDRRRADPGDDLVSAVATLELPDGPATAADLVVTLLERDHETLAGTLANLWFQLLTRPEQHRVVRDDQRLVKFAVLETLRHSAPVLGGPRFARHEVERFGRLLPDGAMVFCSAAAANRDPRVFTDPDDFIVERKDLCQREPRGQYRADGLPSGIAMGLGLPSIHPAVPKERPRSRYAITRDVVVAASSALLSSAPDLEVVPEADPHLRSLRLGEMHTCWSLPVRRERPA